MKPQGIAALKQAIERLLPYVEEYYLIMDKKDEYRDECLLNIHSAETLLEEIQ